MIERLFLILMLGIYLLLAVATVHGLSDLRENIDRSLISQELE